MHTAQPHIPTLSLQRLGLGNEWTRIGVASRALHGMRRRSTDLETSHRGGIWRRVIPWRWYQEIWETLATQETSWSWKSSPYDLTTSTWFNRINLIPACVKEWQMPSVQTKKRPWEASSDARSKIEGQRHFRPKGVRTKKRYFGSFETSCNWMHKRVLAGGWRDGKVPPCPMVFFDSVSMFWMIFESLISVTNNKKTLLRIEVQVRRQSPSTGFHRF